MRQKKKRTDNDDDDDEEQIFIDLYLVLVTASVTQPVVAAHWTSRVN